MPALIFAVLLCIGWLVPEHFPPWWGFHNEAPAFAGLLGALLVSCIRNRRGGLDIGTPQLAVLFLLALALAQYGLGQLHFAGDLWLVLAYLGGFFLAWTLGRAWAVDGGRTRFQPWETLALAFSIGGTISALMAVTQWLRQEDVWGPWLMPTAHTSRALANLGQPNQLSTLLLMAVVATCVLREQQKISRALLLALLLLQSWALVLTQSRTGMLIVAVLAAWFWWQGGGIKSISRLAVALWASSVWAATWVFQSLASVVERAPLGEQMLQVGLRPLMWRQLLQALWESPWSGYGWLQTAAAQQAGAMRVPGLEQVIYAHNHLLDLALWIGLPLTLTLLALTAVLLWRRRKKAEDPRVFLLVAWLLPVLCHAMLEFPLAYAYFLLPVGILLGMLDRWTEPPGAATLALGLSTALPVVVAFTLLLGGLAQDYVRAEEDFRIARFENRRIGQTPQEYAAPSLPMLTQLETVLRAMRLRAAPGMPEADLVLLSEASRRYSWAPLHFRYALALALNGQPGAAAVQMQLIKGLFGDKLYAQAVADYRQLQADQYPELARVQLP